MAVALRMGSNTSLTFQLAYVYDLPFGRGKKQHPAFRQPE